MTITIDSIRLFELPKPKFGVAESKAIVAAPEAIPKGIQQEVALRLESATKGLATKDNILRLEVKMQEKFNCQPTWLVATILAATGILLTVLKLF